MPSAYLELCLINLSLVLIAIAVDKLIEILNYVL
jgi:hypothetical protein